MTTSVLTPLMQACQNNNPDEVKNLLEQNVNLEETDATERTALYFCLENTNTACMSLLLNSGAKINHQDKDGYTCLHLSVISGNLEMVQFLIKNNADVNLSDSEMHTVCHWAVVCGQAEILDFLLKSNADPETADIHGAYPIHYAAQMCGQVDIWDESINRDSSKSMIVLRKLIEQKVKIDVEDFDQRNALIWAASSGSSEALLELFKAGADPNKHEKDGLTALHCASSRGHVNCIKALIEVCKCSVDIMDNNNCTPVFYSATLGQVECCETLIKYRANLHVQDIKGRTVYHCAGAKGQLKCLKVLFQAKSNIWLRNRRGDYPIQEAYFNKQPECVYLFLDTIIDNKAAKSTNLYDGRSILHIAAAENDLNLCKRLVAGGADVNCLMKTSISSKLTPYDVAKLKNANECARYLKSLGGKPGVEISDKPIVDNSDNENEPIKSNAKKGKKSPETNKKSVLDNEEDEEQKEKSNNESYSDDGKQKANRFSQGFMDNNRPVESLNPVDEKSDKTPIRLEATIIEENEDDNSPKFKDTEAQTDILNTKKKLLVVNSSDEIIYSEEKDESPELFTKVKGKKGGKNGKKPIKIRRTKTLSEIGKNLGGGHDDFETRARQSELMSDDELIRKSDKVLKKVRDLSLAANATANEKIGRKKRSDSKKTKTTKNILDKVKKSKELSEKDAKYNSKKNIESDLEKKVNKKNTETNTNESSSEKKMIKKQTETDNEAINESRSVKKNSEQLEDSSFINKKKNNSNHINGADSLQLSSRDKKPDESFKENNAPNSSRKNDIEKSGNYYDISQQLKDVSKNDLNKDEDKTTEKKPQRSIRNGPEDGDQIEKIYDAIEDGIQPLESLYPNSKNIDLDASTNENSKKSNKQQQEKSNKSNESSSKDFVKTNELDEDDKLVSDKSRVKNRNVDYVSNFYGRKKDEEEYEEEMRERQKKTKDNYNYNDEDDDDRNRVGFKTPLKKNIYRIGDPRRQRSKGETVSPKRDISKQKNYYYHNKLDQSPSKTLNSQTKPKSKSNQNLNQSFTHAILPDDDNTVRLIFKTDVAMRNSPWAQKRYAFLFDRQRLLLKSLYEIRRCRINNRDIVIHPELNNLLLNNYNFDIKKNCKSLKDLERMLEILAIEISEEYKKHNRKSHQFIYNKHKNPSNNIVNPTGAFLKSSNGLRASSESSRMQNNRLSTEKPEQNLSLKIAYKPLLPNDIYKQYYQHNNSNPRANVLKDLSPRDKALILPVITQKNGYSI